MKKYEVVKNNILFNDIIKKGKKDQNQHYIIYNNDSEYSYPRFGIAVGKKVGNAVTRNKLKRKMRMIISENKNLFSKNKDYIIIMKKACLNSTYEELTTSLKKEMKKGDL